MKQFIELIGLDENENRVDVSVCVDKITYMRELVGDDHFSTTIFFGKDHRISVEETIAEIHELMIGEGEPHTK